jgi:Domain of unknown function (DUF1707)
MPDGYQPAWHHVGMGDTLEFLAAYGALLVIVALVAAGVWLAHRRAARERAPVHRWPTASLANPSPSWGHQHGSADEGRLRASHADRDRAVELLREATGAGYLTLDEFEERLGKVYSARYLRDLDQLVDDIPGRPAALAPARSQPERSVHDWGWRPLPARSHPAVSGGWIVFALVILTVALHAWWLPVWPLLLVVFLCFRAGRHHRHGAGHWGSKA